MTLYDDISNWQELLQKLLTDADELRDRVGELERYNAYLQQKLMNDQKGNGFEALNALYNEGYHICHAHFGNQREEDCLFCLSLLHHEGRNEPEDL